jgi:hypothetical protein
VTGYRCDGETEKRDAGIDRSLCAMFSPLHSWRGAGLPAACPPKLAERRREARRAKEGVRSRVQTLAILVFLLPVGLLQSQPTAYDNACAKVLKIETALQELIADDRPCSHLLEMDRVLPGSGPQRSTVRFWYLDEQASPDSWERTYRLAKVSVTGNLAARVFSREYYFDKGALILYRARPDTSSRCGETAVWFDKGAPAKVFTREKDGDCRERSVNQPAAGGMDKEIAKTIAAARDFAREYAAVFLRMLKLQDDAE